MSKPTRLKFQEGVCTHCLQTTNYAMKIDRGTAHIVLAVYNAVRRLGRNRIHIDKEMVALKNQFTSHREMVEAGFMTSSMQHNVARARYHGLIAFVDRGSGEYLITPKGVSLLRNEEIWKTVIVDKATHKNIGYWEHDGKVRWVNLLKKEPYWAGAYQGDIDEANGTFVTVPQQISLV